MDYLGTVKAYSTAIWEDKNLNAIDRFFASDALIHSPVETAQGTAKIKSVIAAWHQGFPDLNVSFDDFICEGNQVVSRWRAQGTQTGEFLGFTASNKQVNYPGVTIYQFNASGQIQEYWAFVDLDMLKQQLIIQTAEMSHS